LLGYSKTGATRRPNVRNQPAWSQQIAHRADDTGLVEVHRHLDLHALRPEHREQANPGGWLVHLSERIVVARLILPSQPIVPAQQRRRP